MSNTGTRTEVETVAPGRAPTPAAGLFGRRSYGASNEPKPFARLPKLAGFTKNW